MPPSRSAPLPIRYSIDTSAILDGWVRYYPKDVFPPVWARLEAVIKEGRMVAVDEVLVELKRKVSDGADRWAKDQDGLFVPLEASIQTAASAILRQFPKLVDTRKDRMSADPFVIALAQVQGCTVVTGERPSTSLQKPNIPDVCAVLNVRCLSMMELFRAERWVFA
jgi:hypothetical protein